MDGWKCKQSATINVDYTVIK